MKKAVTFTVRVAVITGIMLAASTQSARASSGDTHKDRGKSCIAHALHKPTTHPHGFRHVCTARDTPMSTMPDSGVSVTESSDGVSIPTSTIPATTGSSPSGPTNAPPDFSSRAGSDIVVVEVASVEEAPRRSADVPTDITTISPGVSRNVDESAGDGPALPRVVTPTDAVSPVNDIDASLSSDDGSGRVAMPSVGERLTAGHDKRDGALVFSGQVSDDAISLDNDMVTTAESTSHFAWWWLLLLLVIAAESYRRWRRARRNRGAVADAVIAA